MAGRPTDYCVDVAAQICSRIADGESLRSICRDPAMPASSTVFVWLQVHPSFTEQYTRAREAQADALADDILEIADDARNDWMERRKGDGEAVTGWEYNGEHVNRSRLRVDARKWIASKLKPKKYGEHLDIDIGAKPQDVTAEPLPAEKWDEQYSSEPRLNG